MDEQNMPQGGQAKEGSLGPIVGVIIIVAILVIGGLYYYGEKLNSEDERSAEEIAAENDPALEALNELGTSDTIEAIEDDLNATVIEGLDDELQDLENEFNNL